MEERTYSLADDTRFDEWFRNCIAELSEPFPDPYHSWRPLQITQKGAWIAYYVDLRLMMERAQSVLGSRFSLHADPVPSPTEKGFYVKATLRISHPEGTVTYEDFGYAPDDSAEGYKAAATDAYRRVLSHMGIGRYLYHLPRIFIGGEVVNGFFRPRHDPIRALAEAMATQNAEVLFFGTGQEPTEKADAETTVRKPNENRQRWYELLNTDNDGDAMRIFRSLYPDAVSGYTDKQVIAFIGLTNPDEVSDRLMQGDKSFIKQTLDERLGKR